MPVEQALNELSGYAFTSRIVETIPYEARAINCVVEEYVSEAKKSNKSTALDHLTRSRTYATHLKDIISSVMSENGAKRGLFAPFSRLLSVFCTVV